VRERGTIIHYIRNLLFQMEIRLIPLTPEQPFEAEIGSAIVEGLMEFKKIYSVTI
jgi:hypothetical protein